HRLTVTDYYRLGEAGSFGEDERVELIEGEIIDMAPIGVGHASRVAYLTHKLITAAGDRAVLSPQNPARLDIYSEPQPDLMLLKPRDDYYAAGHPEPDDVLLLVEVSESSLEYDRDTKLPLYAKHGVAEVWLVDLVHRRLTAFRQPGREGYGEVFEPAALGAVTISQLPGITVDLGDLFPPGL
ncbi:MAG: Uma2 family endonuclease, partial [Salinisphaera sp.]|nr:Uma2 family endonuclease [Salinisphaera sp.]